jgi:TetR/AcrR family transcriptional regulator of autoinduction and epiphytic fitness
MPRAKASAPAPSVDPKRRKLLEAAFTTFVRYGFRKTSMEEVARAAQVSRQGLYLHFSTKEELFRAGAELALAEALGRAQASLKSPKLSLEARLVGALDAWFGEYVGATPPASDLFEASQRLVGPLVEEYEARFDDALTQAIRRSALASAHRLSGLGARELAFTLQAAARGHKYAALSRKDFVHGVTLAARALLTPLKGRR